MHVHIARLQSIPMRDDFPGDKDKDVLFRFLSENSDAPSLPKTPDEKLADILFRNLWDPKPKESWDHLMDGVVKVVFQRPQAWEMVNAVMEVSPSLLGTRVMSASALYAQRANHGLAVSVLVVGQRVTSD
jgi:hypothetical protein